MTRIITPFLFVVLVLCFIIANSSCQKDPEVITNTIVETDTLVITQIDTVTLRDTIIQLDTVILTEMIRDTATTFILVRHAETTGTGSTRSLSAEGQARALTLQQNLANLSLSAVYSTNFNRTRETAQPTADNQSLQVEFYNAFNLSNFVNFALDNHHSKIVLVVGHSNTTPDLVNILIGENRYPNFPETEYNNLFVVTVFERGRAEVVRLKYGE